MEYVEEDPCCICLEDLPKNEGMVQWASCCGKGYHVECVKNFFSSTMTNEQKSKCPHCQTKFSTSPEEEFKRSLVWAEKGKATFQRKLGTMFYTGQGVEQSYEKAVEYYTMAAEQGHAVAQCNLGTMFENGQGVEQSCPIARKWWTKAANQGQEDAINYLKKTPEKIEGTTTTSSSRCSACGKPKSKYQKLRKCSGCHAVQYCNTECQKKHWKIGGHKKECKRLKQQQQNTK